MPSIEDDRNCFVCGPDNPAGLHLNFQESEDEIYTRLRFAAHFQGWKGVTHGGLVSTLLDEIMAKAVQARGMYGVTAEMCVRFRRPVPTEIEVEVSGRVMEVRKRLVFTEGEIKDLDGSILASAKATFFIKEVKSEKSKVKDTNTA